MKRLLVLFAVLVPLSLFIAGCGGTGGTGGSKGAPPKEAQEEMKSKMMEKMKSGTMPGMQGGTPSGAVQK